MNLKTHFKEKKRLQTYLAQCSSYKKQVSTHPSKTIQKTYHAHYTHLQHSYEKRLSSLANKEMSMMITAFVLLCFGLLFSLGDGLSGFATYSTIESQPQRFESNAETDLNTILLDGVFEGAGVRVYLDLAEKSHLLFESNTSAHIKQLCDERCLKNKKDQNAQLRVEFSGEGSLLLNSMSPVDLHEFSLSSTHQDFLAKESRYFTSSFTIQNDKQSDFSLEISTLGDLTDYIKLSNTSISFSEDLSEQKIRYDIDLPLKIEPGRYEQHIIVSAKDKRSIREVHTILVEVANPNQPSYLLPLLLIALMAIITINFFFFFFRKHNIYKQKYQNDTKTISK